MLVVTGYLSFPSLHQNVICTFCTSKQSFGYCLFIPWLKKGGEKGEPSDLTFFGRQKAWGEGQTKKCRQMNRRRQRNPGHTASYCGWSAKVRCLQDHGCTSHGDADESCQGQKVWTRLLQHMHACRGSGWCDFYRQFSKLWMSGNTIQGLFWF